MIEEIESRLSQFAAEYKKALLEATKEDMADGQDYSLHLRAAGFRKPNIPPDLQPILDEYFSARILPELKILRAAILHAVAEELARGGAVKHD